MIFETIWMGFVAVIFILILIYTYKVITNKKVSTDLKLVLHDVPFISRLAAFYEAYKNEMRFVLLVTYLIFTISFLRKIPLNELAISSFCINIFTVLFILVLGIAVSTGCVAVLYLFYLIIKGYNSDK